MDEKQKLNIIENLIENRFDKDNFSKFISNILNVTVRNRKESTVVWTEYKEYIESYQIFGDYEDSNNQRIYVIAVKVKDKVDPTRAKVKQREIIAKMLREYRKDGALVAFYNENDPHWRMAFVKLEYSFTAKGLEEKLTPAKRLSYIIGEGEASHTVKKQFITLIKLSDEVTLDNLEQLFQLEKVTNEFFDEYKKKYLDLKEYLESNEEFMKEAKKQNFENPENFSEGFAKKLMGQLAFLYFLQKKGWLGVKIVPRELSLEDYNTIIESCLSDERDIFINSYIPKGNMLKLSREVKEYSIVAGDKLANCFRNYQKFDQKWGTGEKKFIRNLFQRHLEIKDNTGKNRTFFDDYLEELFYEALNLDRGSNQYFKKFNCKIPFLNGGLFEPYNNYDWKNTDFKIPDALFSNENNDGILDIFDRYNFTISENEPYETEVAVDPEMLGKVFENLLDISDRKSKGAFYTPREIVHYMCKESLINYLLNEIEEINREEVEYLIQLGEFTREYDEHLFEEDYMDYLKGEASEFTNAWGMPKSIRKNAQKIDSIIKDVRVADPAIGSGAFPLGMLNEIVKVRNILTQYILFEEALKNEKLDLDIYKTLRYRIYNSRSLYNLKIETIENSLYGVDIEPSAVDIAKLRLWLSIVVDTRDNDIRPLPNLDFNFMVGNSLIDEFDGVQLFDEKLLTKRLKETYTETTNKFFNAPTGYQKDLFGGIETLKADIIIDLGKYHKAFFKERNTDKKKEIKNEIEKLEWLLITETLIASGNQSKIKELENLKQQKRKPYFLWKLEFAKVFQEKNGFDIVIGNPPYIGFHNVPNKEINKRLFYSANGKYDFYVLFIEKAFHILKEKGTVNYICPSYFYKRNYGKKLREFILSNSKIKIIIDFSDNQIFETAQTYTCIFLAEKNKQNKESELKIGNSLDKENYYIKQNNLKEPQWIIEKNEENELIQKLKENSKLKLKNITNSISQGIVTGDNRTFILDEESLNKNNINMMYLKKVFKGKDIGRVDIDKQTNYIFYPYISDNNGKNILISEDELKNNNINLYKYLEENKERLSNREYFTKSNKAWYELWNPRKSKHFYNRKFVFSEINNKNDFYIVDEYFYTDSACGFELKDNYQEYEKIIQKYLNSKIATYFYKKISVPKANGYFIYKNSFLKDFPIPISFENKDELNIFNKLSSDDEIIDYVGKNIKLSKIEIKKIKEILK
ncbi:class I SAM-dependent DNA methyltransferase [Fusobacterium ulcerans]|uniref:Eco57I restriction-modification methylase domain-containing protein n=1 Tax=Fusobacterium ulcerans TaxID=861 RepID=UPI0034A958B9